MFKKILQHFCFFFVTVPGPSNALEKANLIVLNKEATENDRSLKTQLLVSNSNCDEKDLGGRVWCNQGFFGNLRDELNILKFYFPENTLIYANQSKHLYLHLDYNNQRRQCYLPTLLHFGTNYSSP